MHDTWASGLTPPWMTQLASRCTTARTAMWRPGPRGLVGFVAGALLSLVVSAVLLVTPRASGPGALVDRDLRAWGRWWLRALRADVEVSGLDNVTPGQPYVIVANHQSALDPMAVLAALPFGVRFLAKAELFRLPLFGAAMHRVGMVAVDRGSVDARAVSTGAAEVLASRRSLLVFPEGTVSADGTFLPFKPGAFAIAVANAVPILPVTIIDSRIAWPVGQGRVAARPVAVRVVVGEPLPTEGLVLRDIVRLRAQARDAVATPYARLER